MNETVKHIRYLKRHEIDLEKWDQSILDAPNGLIYARSFYLDTMAENWCALVAGDYDSVMPLTWNRKYGFHYLYQPPFMAQLGIFGIDDKDRIETKDFVDHAKKYFKFCEIHLNAQNDPGDNVMRANYILSLSHSYPEIRSGYKKRLLENLNEALSHDLRYVSADDFSTTISLFQSAYGSRFPQVKKRHYHKFGILCSEMAMRNMLLVRQVTDTSGELLSSSIFFKDHQRLYNIMSVTLQEGREKRSHFHLIDQLIREYAASQYVLDFEGSEVPGIAEFYQKFGSKLSAYPFLKYNHLPFPFRFFKK
jgi:hypothetical protein